jgi:hypothetical protein
VTIAVPSGNGRTAIRAIVGAFVSAVGVVKVAAACPRFGQVVDRPTLSTEINR